MAPLRWNEPIWNRTQAIVAWGLGIAGVINELFIVPEPRPLAWPIIGVLLGLPPARAWDKMREAKADPS